jgi:hypothetical protein
MAGCRHMLVPTGHAHGGVDAASAILQRITAATSDAAPIAAGATLNVHIYAAMCSAAAAAAASLDSCHCCCCCRCGGWASCCCHGCCCCCDTQYPTPHCCITAPPPPAPSAPHPPRCHSLQTFLLVSRPPGPSPLSIGSSSPD